MSALKTSCPPDSVLSDFGLGKLDAAGAETISQHLETCADCRQRVAEVSGDSFVGRLRQAGGPDPPAERREQTDVSGESLTNAANSTDGTSQREDGLPRPLPTADGLGRPPDGLGRPSSAAPELANHPDYELIKELGRGGMGVVYLAKNRMMDRLEVLKVVSPALLAQPGALERFQREIRSAARLLHPNIVAAHSVLRPGDLLVFAMEYVKGQDLSQVVKQRGPLPVANAAFYVHQVALGLQHAHEKGMVHRDIKPNNLMLSIDGKKHVVKILDFGLAKATSEKGAETGLTKSGQMLGTPDYVAPEQTLDAHQADIRADIYSLGCTLYFLLSGQRPFRESSLYAILEAHQKREAKPLNLLRPDMPIELATIVAKMMAKEPAKRYQTPDEVAQALVPFFKPGQAAPTPFTAGPSQPASESVEGTGTASLGSPLAPPRASLPVAPLASAATGPALLPAATAPFGVSIDAQRAVVRRRGRWSPLPPWQMGIILAAGAVATLVFGIVFFLRTKDGVMRVEINDPQIEVAIKGTSIVLKQADKRRDITLSPGGHTLVVRRGGFTFETDKLVLKKGDRVTVHVELLAGKLEVKQGDKLIDQAELPAVWHGWPADAPQPAIAPFSAEQAKKHQQAWADYLKLPLEHTNSIGMKFVLIPPGEFAMGSTAEEVEIDLKFAREEKHWHEMIKSEAPQHKVILTQPIYLGVDEVTQAEYEQVMGKNPSNLAKTGPQKQLVENIEGMDTAGHPVEGVSWSDAANFCDKLSEREKLHPFYVRSGETVTMLVGTGYQLPTEAEWEFACRAGTTKKYWIGDKDEDLLQVGWFNVNSGRTHQVGELKANPFGLYDNHGNVWEWVRDWWEPTYYGQFQDKPALDPSGPTSAGSRRVMRGGDWRNDAFLCRSSRRRAYDPAARGDYIGFRVSLPVAALKNAHSQQPDKLTAGWHGWPVDKPEPAIAPFSVEQAKKYQQAWADYLKLPVEHTNSLGMKFVLIPPGEFTMGSTPEEIEQALKDAGENEYWQERVRSEAPQHKVVLTRPIYLGVHEVTQREYEAVMGQNPSHFAATGVGKDLVAGMETTSHPVEMVSWNDAAEFCAKLSEQEKLTLVYLRNGGTVAMLDGTGYRLPTEAEWEFACRAGTASKFSSGERDQDLIRVGWFGTNSGGRTHEVEELTSNSFGLFDMLGNVWEWAEDSWQPTFYEQFEESRAIDPKCLFSAGSQRVMRGGGWEDAFFCRSSLRNAFVPTFRYYLGFRVVLPVAAVKSAPSKEPDLSVPKMTASSDGWVPLFNGKDLTGWKTHASQPGNWRVEKGVLIGSGPASSHLFSERGNFTNLHLRVETRINDGGNSGVFARSAFGLTSWGADGYEAQINSTATDKNKTGSLYAPDGALVSIMNTDVRPKEWFTLEIIAADNHIVVKVNGRVTADYVDSARRFPMGHIALQQHDPQTVVEFRKIEVAESGFDTGRATAGAVWHGWPADAPPPAIAPFSAEQAKKHQQAWADYLRVPVEHTNGIGMKFMLIPPGEFTMGSTAEQVAAAKKMAEQLNEQLDQWMLDRLDEEMPAHRVTITRPYLVGATEVTVGQFRRFVEATGYVTEAERYGGGNSHSTEEKDVAKKQLTWRAPGYAVAENSNVSQVSWHEAVAFCNWLSEAERLAACYRPDKKGDWLLESSGTGYRLPTEAEWEYACRAGTTTQFSFGDDPAKFREYGWKERYAPIPRPMSVAAKLPNVFGLYDMHGNVLEWCYDWYGQDYYARSAAADPTGPESPFGGWRVRRGGFYSWCPLVYCRSAFRAPSGPRARLDDTGFRVVRVSTDE